MRVRILYAPPQTGYVCGSVIEADDNEAAVLVGSDLAEETDFDVTHEAPPPFYMASTEATPAKTPAAAKPAAKTGEGDGDKKPAVDVAALEAAVTKAAAALDKLKVNHAKADAAKNTSAVKALVIKIAAAEKALAEANAAIAAAKGA